MTKKLTNDEKLIKHLRKAVALGFMFGTPGSHPAVRNAFPDFFADEKDIERAMEYHQFDDDLEIDDHPLVSRGDDGFWVNCWAWSSLKEEDEGDDLDEGTTAEESVATGA